MIKEIPKHTRINCITFIIRELAVHAYIHIHTHTYNIYTDICYILYITRKISITILTSSTDFHNHNHC